MPTPARISRREELVAEVLARLAGIVEGTTYWNTLDPDNLVHGFVDLNEIPEGKVPFVMVQAGDETELVGDEGISSGISRYELTLNIRGVSRVVTGEDPGDTAEKLLADIRTAVARDTNGLVSVDLGSLIIRPMATVRATSTVEQGRSGWVACEVDYLLTFRRQYGEV